MKITAYEHIIEYYVNDNMVKEKSLSGGVILDPEKYWEDFKKSIKHRNHKFLTVGKFRVVSKHDEYDYIVERLSRI